MINGELDNHIKKEWSHFIEGTYGLCTKSSLPSDIAAKELAVIEISELTEVDVLTLDQMAQLTLAVNLSSLESSLSAPHQRFRSSRHGLNNEIRRHYKLHL